MNKKQIVRRDDYELYSISMPFLLRKKERDHYIFRQLEKMHPRFSSRCSVDSNYHLSKKGLMASVAVMDSVTLAKYKAKQNARLCLEGNKNRVVFSMHNPSFYMFIVCAVLTLLFVLSYVFTGMLLKKTEIVQQPVETMTAFPQEDNSVSKLSVILDNISSNNGMLNSLTILQNQIILETADCYPEQIVVHETDSSFQVSQVMYMHDKPVFSVSFMRKPQTVCTLTSELDLFAEKLRFLVQQCGVHIQSELSTGSGMTFSADIHAFTVFVQSLSDFCLEYNLDISSITCSRQGKLLNVSFELGKAAETQKIHSLVAMYSQLFGSVQEITPVQMKETKVVFNPIGTVLQKDGSLLQFYLDEDGKIKGVYR